MKSYITIFLILILWPFFILAANKDGKIVHSVPITTLQSIPDHLWPIFPTDGFAENNSMNNPDKIPNILDIEQWSQITLTNLPPKRYYHAQVYDAKRNIITIFGGWHYNVKTYSVTIYDDTWQVDLNKNSWQKIETDIHPSARASHVILDSLNDRILLFGGTAYTEDNVYTYNDLWQFKLDSLKWSQLYPTGDLPGSIGSQLIFDSVNNRVLFFGGESIDPPYETLNETWALELDGLRWEKLATKNTSPNGRVGHGTIYEPTKHRMIIFGGKYHDQNTNDTFFDDMWELNLNTLEWNEIAALNLIHPARAAFVMVQDIPNNRLIVFGGENSVYISLNDLWEFNFTLNKWKELVPGGVFPEERAWFTGDYDHLRNRMLIFGGNNSFTSILNDTWELTLPKQPTIILVPENQPTIQAGIDIAIDGDLVLVNDSTYYENINFKGKAITVTSYFYVDGDTNHINNTIINGSQNTNPDSGSVVYFVSGEDSTSVICGVTITKGSGTETSYVWDGTDYQCRAGGGIFFYNSGAEIINSKIINNTVHSPAEEVYGGGIAAFPVGSAAYVILEKNQILHNTITADVEIVGGGGVEIFCNARLVNNNISFNSAILNGNSNYAYSGGVDCLSSPTDRRTVSIESNKITHNSVVSKSNVSGTAALSGGIGIYGIQGNITNNEISHNEIQVKSDKNGCGAGIQISEVPESFRIEGNSICENVVTNGKGWGGGINISSNAFPTFINNIIDGNSATNGGGILVTDDCTIKLVNNTLVYNQATTGGGMFLGLHPSKTYLMNTIIWGNQALTDPAIHIYAGTIDVSYSDLQGGWAGTGNMDVAPKFLDSKCHLCDDSPCIDMGNPEGTYNDIEDTGNPGFALFPSKGTTRNDIGAFGGPGASNIYVTAIKNEHTKNIIPPTGFTLFQNYPNPFNPVTTITYELPINSHVELSIYNLLGQKVATLISGQQAVGRYTINWDATGFASGVYYYRITANSGFVQTRKCILIK
jgi:predicted outer membrane repeat protein